MPNLTLQSSAPAVRIAPTGRVVKVTCPYCKVGSAPVVVENDGDVKARIESIHDPRRCDFCGQLFLIKPRLVLEGIALEG